MDLTNLFDFIFDNEDCFKKHFNITVSYFLSGLYEENPYIHITVLDTTNIEIDYLIVTSDVVAWSDSLC